ncbi:MAG TPA: hypothetical protein VH590_15250, partial [Ktedonobacterales bacterium]
MKHYQRWLLHFYPRGWRGRYEEEFVALLEACPFSLWTIWDVCLGAIDAHLHLETLNGRMMPFMNRLRTTSVIVFCAYIGFVVAGLAFGKLVEYDDFMNLRDHNIQVGAAYYTLYAGAFIALAAVLVGGLPLAFAAARDAIARKRWRLLALFAVPPVTLALWLAYIFIAEALDPHPTPILARPLLDRIIGIGLFGGLFVLAAILSTAAVCMIVIRSDISAKLFRFARIPAIIAMLAMVVMFAAVVAYGLVANAADPELFTENNGILATNTTLSLLLILAMMAIATAVAIAALIRGNRSGSGAPTT